MANSKDNTKLWLELGYYGCCCLGGLAAGFLGGFLGVRAGIEFEKNKGIKCGCEQCGCFTNCECDCKKCGCRDVNKYKYAQQVPVPRPAVAD